MAFVFPVKPASWPGLANQAVLRWRIRHELRHLKAAHQRLLHAASQVQQMKSAIDRWTRN